MVEPICANCRHWPAKRESYGTFGESSYNGSQTHSRCRRRAPVIDPRPEKNNRFGGDALWPMTRSSDSCGDFARAPDIYRAPWWPIIWSRLRWLSPRFLFAVFVLRPLIFRDYRLRQEGKRPDEQHWADVLAMRWDYCFMPPPYSRSDGEEM
jgi:hypothetical protein